jgi:hypothetical protein
MHPYFIALLMAARNHFEYDPDGRLLIRLAYVTVGIIEMLYILFKFVHRIFGRKLPQDFFSGFAQKALVGLRRQNKRVWLDNGSVWQHDAVDLFVAIGSDKTD